MQEPVIDRVRAAAADLMEVLGAYEQDFGGLAAEFPRLGDLNRALAAALAEARQCVGEAAADQRGATSH